MFVVSCTLTTQSSRLPVIIIIFYIKQVLDTKDKKVRKFLDILPRRGPKAFGIFLDVLKETKNEHIIDKLVTGGASSINQRHYITQPVDLPVGGDTKLPESMFLFFLYDGV